MQYSSAMDRRGQRPMPWYRTPPDREHEPFVLSKFFSASSSPAAPPFHGTSVFPWDFGSLTSLWDGDQANNPDLLPKWKSTVDQWQGAICAGSTGYLTVFPHCASGKAKPFEIKLSKEPGIGELVDHSKYPVRCIAWALSLKNPTEPLIVFAAHSLVFIIDAGRRKLVGRLRGHGGEITSIAVHPKHPYIFCTTSKDNSTRLYDLTSTARQQPNNPCWPPSTLPSYAGPAFGLMASESEGDGIGRCLAVFVGGRSGGHQAAVLGAAFHPTASLLATCGTDRCVKIWRIPPMSEETLSREDKPFFSSDLVHKARVLSISWLNQDTLISHSAPAVMRQFGTIDSFYEEPGSVVIWRWLGFDRFFPPGKPRQVVTRSCASDYRGSQSLKIIASYSLPAHNPQVCIHYDPVNHDPILLVPDGQSVHIVNMAQFKPREPPVHPLDNTSEMEIPDLTRMMGETQVGHGKYDQDEQEDQEQQREQEQIFPPPPNSWPQLPVPLPLLDSVPCWRITVEKAVQVTKGNMPDVEACEVAGGGTIILGVGRKNTMYIWTLRHSSLL
ncbi:WD40 repeat-like protein [Cristinia sonorae]|uniref:WD40 repeat-like protein n=1 Tax=Cristinia sonorae TaxID=1940300 RepID=A0A8K0UNR2_9AGAR|nr:WD40 repeat-like protein [Cristinia sonorae]